MGRKRVFIVKLPPEARANREKFLERLFKAVAGDPVLIRVKGDQVRVEVYGGDVLARQTLLGIRRVLEEFSTPRVPGAGMVRIPRRVVYREAGVAIPLDVLELLLSRYGYETRVEDDEIVTKAPTSLVYSAAREIARMLEEMKTLDATRTAKKFLMAVGAATGAGVLEAIDWGFEHDVLEEDDEGKLYLNLDWREAVKRVLAGKEGGGLELGEGGAEEDR